MWRGVLSKGMNINHLFNEISKHYGKQHLRYEINFGKDHIYFRLVYNEDKNENIVVKVWLQRENFNCNLVVWKDNIYTNQYIMGELSPAFRSGRQFTKDNMEASKKAAEKYKSGAEKEYKANLQRGYDNASDCFKVDVKSAIEFNKADREGYSHGFNDEDELPFNSEDEEADQPLLLGADPIDEDSTEDEIMDDKADRHNLDPNYG